MAASMVATVEIHRVTRLQRLHDLGEVSLRRLRSDCRPEPQKCEWLAFDDCAGSLNG